MKQPCKECGFMPKAEGSHRCWECNLRKQPIQVQIDAALKRLVSHSQTGAGTISRVPKRDWPKHRRWCAGCQTFRLYVSTTGALLDFSRGATRCRPCVARARADHTLRTVYGMMSEQYAAKLGEQGGVCAICWQPPVTKRLAVDHDHRTGQVRGLLCSRCNHDLLGAAHDSLAILRRAVTYLEHYAGAS